MGRFVYSESLGKSRIRLLRVLPSKDTESTSFGPSPLRIELHTIDFNGSSRPHTTTRSAEPKYEALSYTWGTGLANRKITINNHEFSITANLEIALRHLRLSDRVRTLWADAICINQADMEEKSHQVQMMTKIYQEAQRVVIWLGPEAEDSATALMRLELLGKKCAAIMAQHQLSFDELRKQQPQCSVGVAIMKRQALNRDFEATLCDVGYDQERWLKPISNLLSRPWWKRAWIRQELAVGKDPIVVCGQNTIPWSDFAAGIMLLMIMADYRILNRAWDDRETSNDPIELFGDLARPDVLTLVQFRETFHSPSSVGMDFKTALQMLTITGHAKCTDARDRIFSIVGMTNDLDLWGPEWQLLTPNYGLSVEEVFTRTTRAIIYCCWNDPLDCFRILTYNQPAKNLKTLPSWVPDWTQPFTHNIAEHFGIQLYNADFQISPEKLNLSVQQTYLDEGILKLLVLHFDTIFELGESFEELGQRSQDAAKNIHDWMVNCTNIFQFRSGMYRRSTEMKTLKSLCVQMGAFPYGSLAPVDVDRYCEAMAKTIVMDQSVGQSASPGYYGMSYDRSSPRAGPLETRMFNVWVGREQVPESFLPSPGILHSERGGKFCDAYALRVPKCAMGRRPLLSNGGHFGLVPHTARANDKLVVILGAPVPFVAREVDGYHELIGACYVHGAMNGEMVENHPFPVEAFEFK